MLSSQMDYSLSSILWTGDIDIGIDLDLGIGRASEIAAVAELSLESVTSPSIPPLVFTLTLTLTLSVSLPLDSAFSSIIVEVTTGAMPLTDVGGVSCLMTHGVLLV